MAQFTFGVELTTKYENKYKILKAGTRKSMEPLFVRKNMNMDMSVSSNVSVNGTETMKHELKKIGGKKT